MEAQQVKYPSLSLQWLGSLLWLGFNLWPSFDLWPRNFCMPWVQPGKKKKKKKQKREEKELVTEVAEIMNKERDKWNV